MKKKHNILFCYVSIAIFLSLLVLVGCPSPPNNNNTIATPTSSKPRLRLDTTNKTLTLSFNKSIKSIKPHDNISVYKKSTNTPDSTKNELAKDKRTASTVNGKLVITLTDKLTAGESFYVQMQKDTIIYKNDTSNAHPITSPTVTVPTIFVTKVEIDKAIFTLSFNINLSSKDKNKIEVYKNNTPLTTSTNYTVAIDDTNTTKVKITLTAAVKLNEGDKYKVQFKPNAVKDTNGIGNDAITTNEVSVLLPPALQSKVLERTGNTLTVTFKKAIEITEKNKIEVYKNNTPLTLSNDYTVAIDSADATKIKITLTVSPSLNQIYQVKFMDSAVQDIVNNQPNKFMETNDYETGNIRVWKRVARSAISADWSGHDGHTSVVFDGKIWVLGGQKNDVWSSKDGKTWNLETATAGWTARYGHTSVVFDGKIWVLGGWDGNRKNDVWNSSNGKDWTKVTNDDDRWTARSGHTSVVFDGKIWVLGGNDSILKNDVWNSSNGKDWTKVTNDDNDDDRWTARYRHTSVVFDGKIWVLGGWDGNRKNDVWSSKDGKTWTLEKKTTTGTKSWSARSMHTSVVFDGKIWGLGGRDNKDRKNDVWSSKDGKTWNLETATADWSARYDHSTVVFKNKIWVLGGNDGSKKNDVWTYGLP